MEELIAHSVVMIAGKTISQIRCSDLCADLISLLI